jgi:hypothetical protein
MSRPIFIQKFLFLSLLCCSAFRSTAANSNSQSTGLAASATSFSSSSSSFLPPGSIIIGSKPVEYEKFSDSSCTISKGRSCSSVGHTCAGSFESSQSFWIFASLVSDDWNQLLQINYFSDSTCSSAIAQRNVSYSECFHSPAPWETEYYRVIGSGECATTRSQPDSTITAAIFKSSDCSGSVVEANTGALPYCGYGERLISSSPESLSISNSFGSIIYTNFSNWDCTGVVLENRLLFVDTCYKRDDGRSQAFKSGAYANPGDSNSGPAVGRDPKLWKPSGNSARQGASVDQSVVLPLLILALITLVVQWI